MATGADWMSAASFISMAGLISFMGYDGAVYLMGWTGGYVLLALLLAPYLRKFGKFTVPDFVGDRYYSTGARIVAVVCAMFVSFTYVAGQMRGVGVVFCRFLEVDINIGVVIGMAIVFFYAVLGGMKGITYTQVAQYCVLIFAYLVPAIFICILLTDNLIPQIGFGGALGGAIGSQVAGGETIKLLDKLNRLNTELGFAEYTSGSKSTLDVLCITGALMAGTAGLPHVIVRFYTVPKVRDARISAGWALFFIAILYTTAPAVAAFARTNLIETVAKPTTRRSRARSRFPSGSRPGRTPGFSPGSTRTATARSSTSPGLRSPESLSFTDQRGAHGERLVTNGEPGHEERALRRPRHHRARQPGDRGPSGLGDCTGRRGRPGGGAFDRGGPLARREHLGQPRPAQARVRSFDHRRSRSCLRRALRPRLRS